MASRIVPGLALLLLSASVAAAPPSDSAVARLQSFLHDVHSLKAHFTQTVSHASLPGAQKSAGTVQIKRPNRFRWDYTSPNKELIDADGRNLWIYDAELEQVTVKPLKTTLASSPAMLLSGQGSLAEAFNVKSTGSRDGYEWVALTPKTADSQFTHIEIGLDKQGLRVMQLRDSLGQTTRIEFSDVVRNPPIPEQAFQFKPPPGADVIGTPRAGGG